MANFISLNSTNQCGMGENNFAFSDKDKTNSKADDFALLINAFFLPVPSPTPLPTTVLPDATSSNESFLSSLSTDVTSLQKNITTTENPLDTTKTLSTLSQILSSVDKKVNASNISITSTTTLENNIPEPLANTASLDSKTVSSNSNLTLLDVLEKNNTEINKATTINKPENTYALDVIPGQKIEPTTNLIVDNTISLTDKANNKIELTTNYNQHLPNLNNELTNLTVNNSKQTNEAKEAKTESKSIFNIISKIIEPQKNKSEKVINSLQETLNNGDQEALNNLDSKNSSTTVAKEQKPSTETSFKDELSNSDSDNIQIDNTNLANANNKNADIASEPIATVKHVNQQVFNPIVEHFYALANQEMRSLKINLSPQNLGKVAIELVKDKGGRLNAHILAKSDTAYEILTEGIDALRNSLETAGLVVDKLDVRAEVSTDTRQSNSNSYQNNETTYLNKSDSSLEKPIDAEKVNVETETSRKFLNLRI